QAVLRRGVLSGPALCLRSHDPATVPRPSDPGLFLFFGNGADFPAPTVPPQSHRLQNEALSAEVSRVLPYGQAIPFFDNPVPVQLRYQPYGEKVPARTDRHYRLRSPYDAYAGSSNTNVHPVPAERYPHLPPSNVPGQSRH